MKLVLATVAVILFAACGVQDTGEKQPDLVGSAGSGGPGAKSGDSEVFSIGYTYGKASGNRFFPGKGRLGAHDSPSQPIRIDVSEGIDSPVWLTAAVHPDGGAVWVVTGASGKSVVYRIGRDGEPDEVAVDISSENFSFVPPVLVIDRSGQVRLTTTREAGGLALLLPGAPVEFSDDGTASGDLTITGDGFMIGDDSTIYSYADSTDSYPHGAIGDEYEWGGMWTVPLDDATTASHLLLPEGEVFEGLYPILADFDGDGVQEVIATVSARDRGARLIVMAPVGTGLKVVGISEPIGTGFRWTHQVAVAPFGPGGEMELATIKIPHIGGVAEFYSLTESGLEFVASLAGGYSSHVNGSRNLDMALAADFDGDGNVELLVPSRDRKTLVALRRKGDSVAEAWQLPLDSQLATNLAAVELPDGSDSRISLGAVTADGELFVWQ